MASSDSYSTDVLTLADVQQLANDKSKCIMIINDRVYDVTKFLDEHPGGEEVLKEQHGKNATHAFEDVGHSTDAREQMKAYEIARLHPNDTKRSSQQKIIKPNIDSTTNVQDEAGSSWTKWVIPLVIAVAAVVLFKLLAKPIPDNNNPPRAI